MARRTGPADSHTGRQAGARPGAGDQHGWAMGWACVSPSVPPQGQLTRVRGPNFNFSDSERGGRGPFGATPGRSDGAYPTAVPCHCTPPSRWARRMLPASASELGPHSASAVAYDPRPRPGPGLQPAGPVRTRRARPLWGPAPPGPEGIHTQLPLRGSGDCGGRVQFSQLIAPGGVCDPLEPPIDSRY